MPVSSTASRYGLSTTYSTSYGAGTTSIPRPSSGARTNYIDGYTTSGSYRSGRPLPAGPGPLDTTGRKLSGYTTGTSTLSTGIRRNRTPNGITATTGPLRADHNSSFANSSNRYHSETRGLYGTTAARPPPRSNVATSTYGGDEVNNGSRPTSTSSRPRKSNSLVDLSDLRITSPAGRNRGSSVHNERNSPSGGQNSNTSSRNSMYRDNNNEDIFGLDGDRPDGTSRHGYTPSVTREGSPPSRRLTSPYSSHSRAYGSTSSDMSRHRDGGKIGLKNLGNTCFMNSVLQCLSNTRLLTEWCLDESYLREINTTTSNMKGALIKAYASLMQSLWKEKTESSVAPNAFKTQIQKFASRFMGYAQQDSQEFLRYLLEGLHEDVNRVIKKPAPIILDDDQLEKKNDNGKSQDYWKAYLNRDNSLIVDIFVGQLKSELKFSSCGHRSVTFDPFWDLSLPIPKVSRQLSLDDCLRLFMKEEELAAEERPMCAKCKSRRSCTKSFSIQRFPKILVFHLKRFSQERYGRKLTSVVDFPITHLDLTDYSAEGATGGRRILYDLYAVSNHSGGTGSGHYTAYCKNPYSSEWFYFNDSRVSKVSSNQVVSAEAYVLFYELSSGGSKRSI